MYDLGGRKFRVAGAAVPGCIPSQTIRSKTRGCLEEENDWALKYNQGLQAMLQDLQTELGEGFKYSYTYAVLQDLFDNPDAYGFKETEAACCGIGELRANIPCLPLSPYCGKRSDHIFWDPYHPTEASNRIFVDYIFDGPPKYTSPVNVRQLVAL